MNSRYPQVLSRLAMKADAAPARLARRRQVARPAGLFAVVIHAGREATILVAERPGQLATRA
jgi:hypothetical protein